MVNILYSLNIQVCRKLEHCAEVQSIVAIIDKTHDYNPAACAKSFQIILKDVSLKFVCGS